MKWLRFSANIRGSYAPNSISNFLVNTMNGTIPHCNGVNGQGAFLMARRRYQRGQLIREGSNWLGRWREDVVVGGAVKRVHKKQFIGTTEDFPTKRLAERELERRLAPINSMDYRPTPVMTFEQFAEKWKKSVMVTHKPSTQSSERSHLKKVLVPAFGSLRLRDISPEMVQKWVSESQASPKTTRNLVMTLRSVWATATDWGYVSHDPFKGLKLPDLVEASVYNFTVEEALAIIDKADGKWKTFFRILAETGMRPGELAGLRASDVGTHSLRVAQSVWQQQVQTPKTNRAIRTFAISSALAEEIQRLPVHDCGLVFATADGKPLSMDWFRESVLEPILKELGIRAKLERMGIKRCGNYAFRHMNATLMDEMQVPLKTRQARLGHAQIETTMKHYTHRVDAEDVRIADALGALLSGAGREMMQ